tara:strand:+ start:3175 stop:4065 length:891 start_codon:yes stop_codon:yes gene_type:complete
MEMETMANPQIDEDTVPQEAVEESIFGSDDNQFFADLDQEVNGVIQDDDIVEDVSELPQVEESVTQAPIQGNPDSEQQYVDYEKRYRDSSREAQKMKAQLDEIQPFMPILNRMNEDEGLVETVKDYLINGKTTANNLELPEDFDFSMEDALSVPNSDSAKYFNSVMDNAVSQKVNSILGAEKERNQQIAQQEQQSKDAEAFRSKMNVTNDEFDEMMDWANNHKMTYEDIYFMKNRDKISSNVSNATRTDMLNQMRTVRDIPTSNSNVNTPVVKKDPNKAVLDAIKNLDNGVDNLFG